MIGYSRTALRAGLLLAMTLLAGTAAAAAAAPPPHYTLDAARSLFRFSFVQAGANNTGRFTKFASDVLFSADTLPGSKIDVTVDIAGLDTGDKDRDDTLKGADLFSVAKFPQAHFVTTKITSGAAGRFDGKGKLTMHGVTKDLTVPFTFQTKVEQGKTIGYMTGHFTLKRLDYGVGQGDWKSTEWVNDEVNVTFSFRLVPAAT
jgi:polyisoprenoid-binding protein YceI